MSDRFFLDTNILIYAILESPDSLSRKLVARNISRSHSKRAVISVQILNEFHSVMLRQGVAESTIRMHIQDIIASAEVRPIDILTIYTAWNIRDEYSLSLWDGFVRDTHCMHEPITGVQEFSKKHPHFPVWCCFLSLIASRFSGMLIGLLIISSINW
jgi:predicted nucleic acid-binding protein